MPRTREEERERKRQYRAKKRAEAGASAATVEQSTKLAVVSNIGAPVPPAPSTLSVIAAVRAEVETLPLARKRPAAVATALAMARILDDPGAIPQHPSAAARLIQLMDGLRAEADGGRSKLATLRASRASG